LENLDVGERINHHIPERSRVKEWGLDYSGWTSKELFSTQ
jgi:hypothetical protein